MFLVTVEGSSCFVFRFVHPVQLGTCLVYLHESVVCGVDLAVASCPVAESCGSQFVGSVTACEVLSGNSCIMNMLEPFALSPLSLRSVNVSCALCTVPMVRLHGAGSTSRPTSLTSVQTPGVVTPTVELTAAGR